VKPLVSILIPAYNAGDWLSDAIQSAINQTWSHKEIIVVDDGSTDATHDIATRFARSGVKVITQPNQGAAAARNHAYSLCQGDYIQWLDADDLLAPEKIERQLAVAMRDQDPSILYSGAWARFYFRLHKAHFKPGALWADLSPLDWLSHKMGENLLMQPDAWLVSRQLTDAAGPWDTRLWRDNDGEYFCRVLLKSSRIKFVADSRSYYRRAGTSSISYVGQSDKKLRSLVLSLTLHVKYLRSLEDSARTRAICVRYLQTWMGSFLPHRPDLAAELQELAASLGGELHPPELPAKYAMIQSILGRTVALRAQRTLPVLKASTRRSWDRFMYRLEGGHPNYPPPRPNSHNGT